MHAIIQDAMTYVRCYGSPDLFVTFTCNPKWKVKTSALFSGHSSFLMVGTPSDLIWRSAPVPNF